MADKLQISDLTFEGIKQSLLDYIKSSNTFKDYDFEGSAIRTLIDLLAYNTFYYGFYSNMIANEMFLDTAQLEKSMISLTKPLGYVLTSSACSTASVQMINLNPDQSNLSYFSAFKGVDLNNSVYYFYNIDDITINTRIEGEVSTGLTDAFPIYEGKTRIFRQTANVDSESQSLFISGREVDPRTIVVEVSTDNGNVYERWTNYYTNPQTVLDSSSKVFFVERKTNGYNLIFSKQSEQDIETGGFGKRIADSDIVRISYLISSGSSPNNITNFSFLSDSLGNSVTTSTTDVIPLINSRGGRDTANLDSVRFFAPKTFARQNRLVTKNDYYAILNELGYSNGINPDFDFKVFGGEEATPPYYGRVFVSVLDLKNITEVDQANQIAQIMSILKNQSVITIIPEYIAPTDIDMKVVINAVLPGAQSSLINNRKNAIRVSLLQRYGTKKYNNNFIEDDIIDSVRNSSPGTLINNEGVFVYAGYTIQYNNNESRMVYFKNPISTNSPIGNIEILFSNYAIRDDVSREKLYKYNLSDNSLLSDIAVGEVDYENGFISLYPLEDSQTELTITARIQDDNFIAKDEFVAYLKTQNLQINLSPA